MQITYPIAFVIALVLSLLAIVFVRLAFLELRLRRRRNVSEWWGRK